MTEKYSLGVAFVPGRSGWWRITDRNDRAVWTRRLRAEERGADDFDGRGWPADMRAEYERLVGKPEFGPVQDPGESQPSPVEAIYGGDDGGGFTQPCRFGFLVAGHSVYCHNDTWLYAPRKCRRTWYTGGEERDEDCPGFIARESAAGGKEAK